MCFWFKPVCSCGDSPCTIFIEWCFFWCVLHQALDCFTAMLSRPESRLRMAEIIGSKLNISKEKVFNKPFDKHLSKMSFVPVIYELLQSTGKTSRPWHNLDSWLLFVCRPSTSARCISLASRWASWRPRWAEWLLFESKLKQCSWVCKWDIVLTGPLDLCSHHLCII